MTCVVFSCCFLTTRGAKQRCPAVAAELLLCQPLARLALKMAAGPEALLRVQCRSQAALAILQDDMAAALGQTGRRAGGQRTKGLLRFIPKMLAANPQMTANLRRQSSGPSWLVAPRRMESVARCGLQWAPFCAGVS